jgi:chemotaxis protein methyltransferase CheR
MPISPDNLRFIQSIASEGAALVLDAGKEYLIEARLTPMAREAGFKTLDAFVNQLRVERADRQGTKFHDQIIDALTTSETSFFRDFHPFECLRQHVLPQLIEQRAAARKLSIWSAGTSTGQEAYSIALLLLEHFPQLNDWDVRILGTDVSSGALQQARRGFYSQIEVNRGLPVTYLFKYFARDDLKWYVQDEVKGRVEFRQLNLAKPWPILPMFDVVFVRNVLTCFDAEVKKAILKRIRRCMQPQGFLFLGAAESTLSIDPDWSPESMGDVTVYKPRPLADNAKAA